MSNSSEAAFPRHTDMVTVDENGKVEFAGGNGLTKREWFTGMAMVGFLSNTSRPLTRAPDDAEWCVNWADAVLTELAKRQPL